MQCQNLFSSRLILAALSSWSQNIWLTRSFLTSILLNLTYAQTTQPALNYLEIFPFPTLIPWYYLRDKIKRCLIHLKLGRRSKNLISRTCQFPMLWGAAKVNQGDFTCTSSPPHLKTSEDQLEPKHTQFFWNIPSLHSESMNSVAPVWADSSLTSGYFNRFSDSTVLTNHIPLSFPESQPQNLPQILSTSQSQPVPLAKTQTQLQHPIPVLSPSLLSQLRICGVYFHRPQDKA